MSSTAQPPSLCSISFSTARSRRSISSRLVPAAVSRKALPMAVMIFSGS